MSIYSNQNMTIGEAMDNDIDVANTQITVMEANIEDLQEIMDTTFDQEIKGAYSRLMNTYRDVLRELQRHHERLTALRNG